jgi:hypothetical protein
VRDNFERQLGEVAIEAGRSGRLAAASTVRARGDQRRRRQSIAVTAVSVLLLGGAAVGVAVNRGHRDTAPPPAAQTSTPQPSTTGPAEPSSTPPSSSSSSDTRWVNSKQFMEIRIGQIRNGQLYLEVRPAKKELLGESFETVTIPGPYTEVVLTTNARIWRINGTMDTPEVFLAELARRDPNRPNHAQPDQRKEGFDLTFDGQGRVTRVDWLYVL